jgi:hypothetical protein
MRPSFDVGSIAGRIDQIRRSIGVGSRSVGSGSFQDRLASAVAEQPVSGSVSASASAVSTVPKYFTLGGVPVATALFEPIRPEVINWSPPVVAEGELAEDPGWIAQLPERGRAIVDDIEQAATAAGLDPRLLAAVAWAESTFVPDAVSSAGAIGLTQLMPGTAAALGVDPWDPQENLRGGATYLVEQIERFGTVELGLAAYNAGPGRVVEHGGAPSYTHKYIERVIGYYEELGVTT